MEINKIKFRVQNIAERFVDNRSIVRYDFFEKS